MSTDNSLPPVRADLPILGLLAAGWLACHHAVVEMSQRADEPRVALGVAGLSHPLVTAAERAADALTQASEQAVDDQMSPPLRAMTSFADHTRPGSWEEAVLKVHLMVGAALDLRRLTGENWPADVVPLAEANPALELVAPLRETLETLVQDQDVRSRLGLFGRRVIAEATAQAQRVVARQPQLTAALLGVEEGSLDELSATTQLVADLVEGSAQRMLELKLQP